MLGRRRDVRPLENLDQATRARLGSQRGEHEQVVGGIDGLGFAGQAAPAGDEAPLVACQGCHEQLRMALCIGPIFGERDRAEPELALEMNPTLRAANPNRSPFGRQSFDGSLEQQLAKLVDREFGPGQPREFVDDLLDLAATAGCGADRACCTGS